jgi:two-component system LytT family response regulator
VKADGRLVFLKSDEVVWVEAADNYVVLHLTTGRLMLRETMAAIEARLGRASFVRVNRSALVHRDQIKELQPALHGDYTVLLRDGTKLPLSRSLRGQMGRVAGG